MTIWQISDQKPGHINQVLGLVKALGKYTKVDHHQFICQNSLFKTLRHIKQQATKIARPDFIMGAGHKTHLPLLYSRWKFGGKAIVFMKPSLPKSFFDIIIAPQHDKITGKNIITTKGAINKITPTKNKDKTKGLILIGGESKHFFWDNKQIINNIKEICQTYSKINWSLTNSRRTPKELENLLKKEKISNLIFTPYEKTNPSWVADKLQQSSINFITNDSIAMIYESLTSSAKTNLIKLKPKKQTKIVQSLAQLEKENFFAKKIYLNEADRVAKILYKK